jgi:hypothetical protein
VEPVAFAYPISDGDQRSVRLPKSISEVRQVALLRSNSVAQTRDRSVRLRLLQLCRPNVFRLSGRISGLGCGGHTERPSRTRR